MQMQINRALTSLFNLKVVRAVNKTRPIDLTLSNGRRLIYFYDLHRKIEGVEGDVVECGVGWGRGLLLHSIAMNMLGRARRIYGFDSFEGFPEPHEADGKSPAIKKGRYRSQEDGVRKFLAESMLRPEHELQRIELIKGFFPDSFGPYQNLKVAFLHVDADLYDSYIHCLKFFYPRVAKGGVIAFDEYQLEKKFPGAKRAVDEFLADKPEKLQHQKAYNRYYIIKE